MKRKSKLYDPITGELKEIQKGGETVEKFRPIDGENISQESRETLETAINSEDWETAFKTFYHVFTGKNPWQ